MISVCIFSPFVANKQHTTDGWNGQVPSWWCDSLQPLTGGDNSWFDPTVKIVCEVESAHNSAAHGIIFYVSPTPNPHTCYQQRLLAGKSQESWSDFNFFWPNNTSKVRQIWCNFFKKWYRVICRILSSVQPLYMDVQFPLIPALIQARGLKVKVGKIRLLMLIGNIVVELCVVTSVPKTEKHVFTRNEGVHFDNEVKMFRYTSSLGFEENEYYLDLGLLILSY